MLNNRLTEFVDKNNELLENQAGFRKGYGTTEYIFVLNSFTGPDSLVVRASASGAVGRGFASRSRHTKGVKMVLVAPLLTFASKG